MDKHISPAICRQTRRTTRVRAKILCHGAACALLLGSMAAQAQAIVTDRVVGMAEQSQTHVPVTFGQVFKSGDVAGDATLTATLDGHPVALQVDAKATNPDGSLRHAVLTAMIPSLPEGANLPLTLSTSPAPATPQRNARVTLSQLLATDYDATVSLELGATTYTADARTLLKAALDAGTCKAWNRHCNVWLSGPLTGA